MTIKGRITVGLALLPTDDLLFISSIKLGIKATIISSILPPVDNHVIVRNAHNKNFSY